MAGLRGQADGVNDGSGFDWATFSRILPTEKDNAIAAAQRRKVWKVLDMNSNGLISLAELDRGLVELFSAEPTVSPVMARAKQAIARAFHAAKALDQSKGRRFRKRSDALHTYAGHDQDQFVTWSEFRSLIHFLRQFLELWLMFDAVDARGLNYTSGNHRNADGAHLGDMRIDMDEFVAAVPLIERWGSTDGRPPFVIADPHKTFASIDVDCSGAIRFDEFAQWALEKRLDLEDDDDVEQPGQLGKGGGGGGKSLLADADREARDRTRDLEEQARYLQKQLKLARKDRYDVVAVPAILEYKLLEARCEKLPKLVPSLFPPVSDEEEMQRFQVLHRKWAKPLFDKFMELGGFYYKNGQKIASNQGGVVPKIYVDMFQPFLNDIPPRDIKEVHAVMEAELGRPIDEVFSTFDEKPVGCASIGQVHRATLKSTGERVVVKVQNPEAERTFRGDVFALKVLVDAFAPQFAPAFDEIAKQFATEFDYRGECKNAMEIRANLQKSPFQHQIIVPKVYAELCSKRLMVMEEIYPSIPLHDKLDEQAGLLAKQRGMTKDAFIASEKARIEREVADAAKSGRLVRQLSSNTYERYIKVQKTRRSLLLAWRHVFNATVGLLLPWKRYDLSGVDDSVLVPINAAKLIDDLLRVHGHEVLIDGVFNADPHPGNILYVDGKLGLIDYGQVKRITEEERLGLAKGYLFVDAAIQHDPRHNPHANAATLAKAKAAIAQFMKELGVQTERMDPEVSYEMSVVYFGRMDAAFLYPQNLLQWTDTMQERDPLRTLENVEYFVMVNMATMMLRGLGEILQQSRNLAEVWRPIARQALAEKGRLAEVEAEIASWSTTE